MRSLPADFEDVGLYPRAPEWDFVPRNAHVYTPRHQLWSNGLVKHRHVVLPEGTTVDNRDGSFSYPEGTLLFKTFFVDTGGNLDPVETRLLRHVGADEWDYAVYAWEGDVATRLDIRIPVPSGRTDVSHTIPAELDCRSCHESSTSFVLGWTDEQLVDAYPALYDAGLLRNPPPVGAARIDTGDPQTDAVLGEIYGNCVHCHNGSGGPSSSFDLRPAVALENMIGVPTDSSATAAGVRIEPGVPEDSILFLALSGEGDNPEVKDMPPVGVDVRDQATIELFRGWIRALAPHSE